MEKFKQIIGIAVLAASLGCSALWALPKELAQLVESIPASEAQAEAQKSWDQRDQPNQAERATALWDRVAKDHPELYISLTKSTSRIYRHVRGKELKKKWAEESRRYGALAIEKNPNSAPAHAAYAEALGQWAQANKGVGSLKVVKQAVAQLKKAIAIDETYAFAHMLLAQFYEQSPGWLSVGDKGKALEEAKLAVKHGPNYAINRLTLGKIYSARGDKKAAKEQLEQALAVTPPADAIPETKSDQEEARELLKSL